MTQEARNHTKRSVYELRQKIIGGALPGGTRLYEVALSEELSMSRTPVREAMSRLAEEGLLERVKGGGFVVRSFTYSDVVDSIELRGVLEGTAARFAAERGVEPEKLQKINRIVRNLDSCFDAGGEPTGFHRYSEWNGAFHDALADLCGSEVLGRELNRVKSLPFASPSAFVMGQGGADRVDASLLVAQAQHRAIVEAIEAREGARAESLCREHARLARVNLDRAFVKGGEKLPGLSLIVR